MHPEEKREENGIDQSGVWRQATNDLANVGNVNLSFCQRNGQLHDTRGPGKQLAAQQEHKDPCNILKGKLSLFTLCSWVLMAFNVACKVCVTSFFPAHFELKACAGCRQITSTSTCTQKAIRDCQTLACMLNSEEVPKTFLSGQRPNQQEQLTINNRLQHSYLGERAGCSFFSRAQSALIAYSRIGGGGGLAPAHTFAAVWGASIRQRG
eukprot:651501-Pelagomonas_calceolata.AAC.3